MIRAGRDAINLEHSTAEGFSWQARPTRIALSLPATEEASSHFAFSVRNKGKPKGFVWVWMDRVAPRKARVPQPNVIAVRVANLFDKDFLFALDPVKFFTEPDYNRFPAVLVRPLPSPEGIGPEREGPSSSNGRAEAALVRFARSAGP